MNERILSDDEIEALRKHWATAPTINEAAKRLGICQETARHWAQKLGLSRPSTNPWTPERTELLKTLWDRGFSASQIAYRLGEGISRNSVLGKAHRLGIVINGQRTAAYVKSVRAKKRPSVAANLSKLEKRLFGKYMSGFNADRTANSDKSVSEAAISPTDEDIARVQFSELSERDCRFPVGTPGNPGFGFCALPKMPGSSYCEPHHCRTHTPVPVKRPSEPAQAHATTPVKIDA